MHLQFFYFFSEHIRMAASNYHSNLSIILDIFRKKKTTLQENGYKASVNLRQFVIIKALYNDRYSRWNMSNHMLSKGQKKNENWSVLMSSQDITLLLCPVIYSRGDPVSVHSNIFTISSF